MSCRVRPPIPSRLATLVTLLLLATGCPDGDDDDDGGPAPEGDLEVSPRGLDWGESLCEEKGLAARSTEVHHRGVTLRNVGQAPVSVFSTALTGGGPFVVTGFSGELGAGAEAQLTVTLLAEGYMNTYSAFEVVSDDPDEPTIEVQLCVTDFGGDPTPELGWSPAELDFGEVAPGSDATLTLTLHNEASGVSPDLQLFATGLGAGTSPDFAITVDPSPITLSAGGAAEVDVTYTPSDGDPDLGELLLVTDDPDDPAATIPLSGEPAI